MSNFRKDIYMVDCNSIKKKKVTKLLENDQESADKFFYKCTKNITYMPPGSKAISTWKEKL